MSTALIEQLPLELALIEWCESDGAGSLQGSQLKVDSSKDENIINEDNDKVKKENTRKVVIKSKENKSANEDIVTNTDKSRNGEIESIWDKIFTHVRPVNASTEALLRAAKPVNFDGNKLTLGVYYKFHKERLESNPHRDILERSVSEIIGLPVRLECTLTEPPFKQTQVDKPVLTEIGEESIVKIAEDVFGN